MLIDTHCHLHFPQFDRDRQEVIARAEAQGVVRMVEVGVDLASSEEVVALAERYPQIYAAVGVHPHEASGWDEATLKGLRRLAAHPKVVALGEMGLDYYRHRSSREEQKEALRRQLALAQDLGKPVIIHDREAHQDLLEILEGWKGLRGVFHCFSGGPSMAKRCGEMGFHIAVAGPVTYPNAKRLIEVARETPLERLLLETDSPFLSPHRGQRNEPANVRLVAQRVAQIKGLPWEEVARSTTENARRLFGIALGMEEE